MMTIEKLNQEKNQNNPPVPAETVLRLYGSRLTGYEKNEIIHFDNKIYFIGGLIKKNVTKSDEFDDRRGFYRYNEHDHVAYRYEIVSQLGKGAFAQVFKVYDHKTKTKLALKIIRNEEKFHKQAKTEIKILNLLRTVDREDKFNIVHMMDYFQFRNHICIAFELLTINLHSLIERTKSQCANFSCELIKRFAYSIVKTLCLLSELKIIHADLKPENIVLRTRGESGIKIIDFGTSCFENQIRYNYIQSRFYRAPEITVQCKYGIEIDMWSLGCILYELFSCGKVLFCGKDAYDQLFAILEVIGQFPEKMLTNETYLNELVRRGYCTIENKRIIISKNYFDKFGIYRRAAGKKPLKLIGYDVRHKDSFKDFLFKCLTLDPQHRLKPKTALTHDYLKISKNKSNYILNKIEILKKSYQLNTCRQTNQ